MISPNTITTPVLQTVSHATREAGSSVKHASTMASDMTSHNLSGWDSVTDSDVKRKVLLSALLSSSMGDDVVAVVVLSAAAGLVGESQGAPSPIEMSVGLFVEDAPSPAPSADADAVPTLAVVDIILIVEGKRSV